MPLRRTFLALAFAAVLVVPAVARATATFTGTATSTLTLISVDGVSTGSLPSGLDIFGTAAPADVAPDPSEGSFAATADDVAAFSKTLDVIVGGASKGEGTFPFTGFGDSTVQSVAISGTADGTPGASVANAFVLTDGIIEIDNATGAAVDLVFEFAWEFDLAVSADDPFVDDAFIDVFILLFDDPFALPIFDAFDVTTPSADTFFGPLASTDSDAFTFGVTVADGEIGTVTSFLDIEGQAARIPEPASAVLLAAGLAAFAVSRRRRL